MRRTSDIWSGNHSGFVSLLEWVLLLVVVYIAITHADQGADLLKMLASLAQR